MIGALQGFQHFYGVEELSKACQRGRKKGKIILMHAAGG